MNIFLALDPPTVTAQMHKVTVQHGRVRFYDTAALKKARALFTGALKAEAPAEPMEGPVSLAVCWKFRTKSHKEGEWRTTRPDTDNLQKLLKDCMTAAGYWKDDAQVCIETVTKMWTRTEPGIGIEVKEVK